MKIAIASSGLGHVARGIETWALDTAVALSQLTVDGEQLTVENADAPPTAPSFSVTLFCAAPLPSTVHRPPSTIVLPCLKRGDRRAKLLSRLMPGFSWRWGFKDTYGWEQFTFWMLLWPKLRRGKFDILHVQDPLVAYWCRLFRKLKLVKTKEILAHGTEETVKFLSKFDYVQQLAPWHLEQVRQVAQPSWTAIPNFVDCAVFRPFGPEELSRRTALRASLGIPEAAFVVGCVAAVKKHHKRIDYLIQEMSKVIGCPLCVVREERDGSSRSLDSTNNQQPITNNAGSAGFLLIIGAKTDETPELLTLAESLIPGHYKIMTNLGRSQMPDLLRSMDVFVLTSLFEMMPIALLEALASGLPCVVNRHPVLEWMTGSGEETSDEQKSQRAQRGAHCISAVGGNENTSFVKFRTSVQISSPAGGMSIDMSQKCALAQALTELTPEWLDLYGRQARGRAVKMFSTEAVIGEYLEYYQEVIKEQC